MSSLPLIIVNPASAGGRTAREWPRLASEVRTHFGSFNCRLTTMPGEARTIAREESNTGRRLIIACGGDGTVSEVANGIIESGNETELGILPSGTGGDFRRTIDVPSRISDAALALRNGKTRTIDAGRVSYLNKQGEPEARYFINVASCGISGHIIERVKSEAVAGINYGQLLGSLSFATAALKTAMTFSKPSVQVQLDDGKSLQLKIINLCVANARYFGGGMKIAPKAKLNDDWLDVIVIGDLSAQEVLTNAFRIYSGMHLGIERVYHSRAKRIIVSPVREGDAILLEADGEFVGHLPATFEIIPQALRLRIGKSKRER